MGQRPDPVIGDCEESAMTSVNSFGAKGVLDVGGTEYQVYRLDAVTGEGLDVASLPYSLKVLLGRSSSPRRG